MKAGILSRVSGCLLCGLLVVVLLAPSCVSLGVINQPYVNQGKAGSVDVQTITNPDGDAAPMLSSSENQPVSVLVEPTSAFESVFNEETYASLLTLQLPGGDLCVYRDEQAGVTQWYSGDYQQNRILCYTITNDFISSVEVLPLPYGRPWVCQDLNLDGNLELVVQRGDGYNGFLDIHAAPTWNLRLRVPLPAMNVDCFAAAVNLDADPYLELYLTPSNIPGTLSRAMVIQYNPVTMKFGVTDSLPTMDGMRGVSAIGDVDADGRVECVTGSYAGYKLYEYTLTGLQYGGVVGKLAVGNHASLVSAKPGQKPCLLLGYQTFSQTHGFLYTLMRPTGNNKFAVDASFQVYNGGWTGTPLSYALDDDNDGLQEFVMSFYPYMRLYEWDCLGSTFSETYCWNMQQFDATFVWYTDTDVDGDGLREWCVQDHEGVVRIFEKQGV